MAELDFSAESTAIWSEMENLLMSDLLSAATPETQLILDKLNSLVTQAINCVESEFDTHYKDIRSFQSFSKKFINNSSEIMLQNQLKAQNQLTALQEAYLFLDRAYEIITGNTTQLVMTATASSKDGIEFYKKTYSLREILLKSHTFKEGNMLISSTIQELKQEVKQEKYKIALDNNTMAIYKMFYSLTQDKHNGFNQGHLSEAFQRFLFDVQDGKSITEASLLENIKDSIQNSRFYEEGDLSRLMPNLETTIETQVKNLGQTTNILTIGNYNTVLNGLKKLQILLSQNLLGAELKENLKTEMFSKSSNAPTREINASLKKNAIEEIQKITDFLKRFN